MLNLTLRWPDKGLSHNARIHHMERHRLTKAARREAYYEAYKAMGGKKAETQGRLMLHVQFYPPDDHRRRDLDNCVARCKAYFDGIAQALGVDDSRFRYLFEIMDSRLDRIDIAITPVQLPHAAGSC